MNRRLIWGTIIIAGLLVCPTCGWGQYGGGTGGLADPFLISTPAHMQVIGADPNDWDKHFQLTGDIDLSGFDGVGGNPAYNVIGTDPNHFVGQFDGNGFSISHLSIAATGMTDIGLFGFVGTGGVIKNLNLISPTVISSSGGVGSLVGTLRGGEILSCQSQGCTVSGTFNIGGLIGESSNASIDSCGVTGFVSGMGAVGGLIGHDSIVTFSSVIQACFANTTVSSSSSNAGGLIGITEFTTITNCYSQGRITGNEGVGGLVGQISFAIPNFKFSRCYAACSVSGSTKVGGLIGGLGAGATPVIENSFWDRVVSGQNQMCGEVNAGCDDGAGRTTAEMRQESTFTDPNSNWDFVGETTNGVADIWRICEGTNTPKLAWQVQPAADWVCPDGVGVEDFAVLAEAWLLENLSGDVGPNGGDGTVNYLDWGALSGGNPVALSDFVGQWLNEGTTEGDIAPNGGDGFFNLVDFAELVSEWMTGL